MEENKTLGESTINFSDEKNGCKQIENTNFPISEINEPKLENNVMCKIDNVETNPKKLNFPNKITFNQSNDDKSIISFKDKITTLKISQERISSNSSSGIESSSDLDTEIEKCDKLLKQTSEIISLPVEDENILVVNEDQNLVDTPIQSSENSSIFATISTEPKTIDEEKFSITNNNLFLCCENKSEETTSFIDKFVFTKKEVDVLNNGESYTNDKVSENLLDASTVNTDKSNINSKLQSKNNSDSVGGSCKESICTSNNCLNRCNIEKKAAIIKDNDENVIFKKTLTEIQINENSNKKDILDASTVVKETNKMYSTKTNKNNNLPISLDVVDTCKELDCTSTNTLINNCSIENKEIKKDITINSSILCTKPTVTKEKIKIKYPDMKTDEMCVPSKSADQKLDCEVGNKTNEHANSSNVKENEPVELYLELEKDDITDPGWEKMKDLTTDAERYKVVKQCWKSETVPNINKNLTNYGYRKKRLLSSKEYFLNDRPKQHKRHASCALDRNDTKRARSCTVMWDMQINSINQKKNKCVEKIQKQMDEKLNQLNRKNLYNLYHRNAFQQTLIATEASLISEDYSKQFHNKNYEFQNKLNYLNKIREEILQFHSFYKGLNSENDCEDPTVLTNSQFNEINEIESIYPQFDKIYGSKNN